MIDSEYSYGRLELTPDRSIEEGECHCSLIEKCRLCKRAGSLSFARDGSEPRWCGHGPGGTCDQGHCYDCDACSCGEDW